MGSLKNQYKNVKVSVIVPIYNVEKYLKECLDSICVQTHTNLEIICVNDGSTDGCAMIVDDYAGRDERIKVVHKSNAGYGHAVNVGMDMANGKYIQVVEPDDYIAPSMTETLVKVAEKYDLDMVKADYNIFKGEGTERTFEYVNIAKEGQYNTIVSIETDANIWENGRVTWAGIFKREFLDNNNIRHNESPGAAFQDNGFWFQTIALAKRVRYIDCPLYNLRRDNPNSSFFNSNKIEIFSKEYDFIKDFVMRRLSGNKKYLEIHNKHRLLGYIWCTAMMDCKYINDFHRCVVKDIKREETEKNIDISLCTKRSREIYQYILNNDINWLYVAKYYVTQKKWECIKSSKNIIIYGAGIIGRRLAAIYRKEGLTILGFAVSKAVESREVDGFMVKCIDEWKTEIKNVVIIVAVADKLQKEIVENLEIRNISNYITLD